MKVVRYSEICNVLFSLNTSIEKTGTSTIKPILLQLEPTQKGVQVPCPSS